MKKDYKAMTKKELLEAAFWYVQRFEYFAQLCYDAHQRNEHNHPGECFGDDVEDALHDSSSLGYAMALKINEEN